MLHNNEANLNKVKSNLEEALYSHTLMMNQNSGRAGQFAGAFVAIYDALERVKIMLEPTQENEPEATEEVITQAKASAKKNANK